MTKIVVIDVEDAKAEIESRTVRLLEYFVRDGRQMARLEVPNDWDPDKHHHHPHGHDHDHDHHDDDDD